VIHAPVAVRGKAEMGDCASGATTLGGESDDARGRSEEDEGEEEKLGWDPQAAYLLGFCSPPSTQIMRQTTTPSFAVADDELTRTGRFVCHHYYSTLFVTVQETSH